MFLLLVYVRPPGRDGVETCQEANVAGSCCPSMRLQRPSSAQQSAASLYKLAACPFEEVLSSSGFTLLDKKM